jgi:5-methylthioadenosine/S-adenosylhomocysteine deaminase
VTPAAPGWARARVGDDAPDIVDLVVRGGQVVTMDPERRIVTGDVVVRDGRIDAVGGRYEGEARHVVDATRCAVLPGLVNAHMHECMERGLFEDLPFTTWLEDFALPKDRAYEPRHQRAAAGLNQLEMIRNGTTTFIDIFRYPDEAAEVALRSGLRAIFSPQVIDTPEGVGESLESNVAFIERWQGRETRIQAWFGPHALYSCAPGTYEQMAGLAADLGTGLHTHLAESVDEVIQIHDRHAATPAAYLDRLIGDHCPVLVAHAIHLDDADIGLIADRGWAVAHCPTSNMKLANGTARVPDLLAAGVTVGLGSDSIMTNNNLDLFEEMRQAALIQKLVRRDATCMPTLDVLAMATLGSAAALGLGDEIGSLEVGKRADLIVVDLNRPHLWPLLDRGANLVDQLVYSASGADVRTTVVDGRVLMEDGNVVTLDAAEIDEAVHREIRHLLNQAGLSHV